MGPVLACFLLAASPEQRAVDYLAREAARWPRENHCFSCHNNGDAARALLLARKSGYAVPETAFAETRQWLSHPERWEKGAASPGFNNAALARIQFAAALVEMDPSGGEIVVAGEALETLQQPDGRWEIDTGGMPGAPATYGTALATYLARQTLERASGTRFAAAIARSGRWLERATPSNVVDAAAMLLAAPRSETVRRKCLPIIRGAQTSDGGWGPQARAPAEVFDTAVALLALQAANEHEGIRRGRQYLLSQQQSFGGWPETTRPSGHESYAEHISTSAWALQALLSTDPKRQ